MAGTFGTRTVALRLLLALAPVIAGMRFMNASNMGTVKAVSPWLGLQIMSWR